MSVAEASSDMVPQQVPTRVRIQQGGDLWVLVISGIGLVLAVASATRVQLTDMTDLGLASVLPVTSWVALGLICVAFALALLRDPTREILLAVPVIAMSVAAFAVVMIASPVPRDHVSFRHVGIVDHLVHHHAIDDSIDAYFSWPGFFTLGAFFSEAAGEPNLLPIIHWAPLVARFALLGPLILLMRSLLQDRRAAWTAVWIAVLWDWVDQDYFAPQTFALFLHLVVLALVAGWLLVDRRAAAPRMPGGQRLGMYLIALGLALAIVPAHQLTPIATGVTLAALAVSRRLPQFGLPVLVILSVAVWLVTGAHAYQSGHDLLSMPDLSTVLGANVSERVTSGSQLHQDVVLVRMAMSASLWLLAACGFLRAWRAKQPVLVPTIIAAAPFVMLPMQAYGGEMLMRVHLFALPGMAVLAVLLLAPPGANRRRSTAAILIVSLLAVPGLMVARYGTDRLEIHTPDEVAAVDALYAAVPHGGLLVSAAPYVPWRDHDYDNYRYRTLVEIAEEMDDPSDPQAVIEHVVDRCEAQRGHCGLIITDGAHEGVEMLGSTFALGSIEWLLGADPRFEKVYQNPDGVVYVYRGGQHDAG